MQVVQRQKDFKRKGASPPVMKAAGNDEPDGLRRTALIEITKMTEYKPIAESNNFIIPEQYTPEWTVAESYQSENDLERELINDLRNQG
jgi:hypothetical protein